MSCHCPEGVCLHGETYGCECYRLRHPKRVREVAQNEQQHPQLVVLSSLQLQAGTTRVHIIEPPKPLRNYEGESFGGDDFLLAE